MTATLIGYARCSTDKQDLTAQKTVLAELGVAANRIYVDEGLSGTNCARLGLDQALAAVREGDTLVVPKLDRLVRSVPDARHIAGQLEAKGVKLALGRRIYDPADPMGKMFFNILATFAEFEADLIRMRTREGMAVARAKGKLRGKQPKLTDRQQHELCRMHATGNYSIGEALHKRSILHKRSEFCTRNRFVVELGRVLIEGFGNLHFCRVAVRFPDGSGKGLPVRWVGWALTALSSVGLGGSDRVCCLTDLWPGAGGSGCSPYWNHLHNTSLGHTGGLRLSRIGAAVTITVWVAHRNRNYYDACMIRNFRSHRLKRFCERGQTKWIDATHRDKVQDILTRLDASDSPEDMDLPGFGLHLLRGEYAGFWSVTVQGNWRVIFQFSEGHAVDVDYLDYH